MHDIDLSFHQLRQDIFEGLVASLDKSAFVGLHAALIYGRDPDQMILPLKEEVMVLSTYGAILFRYNIPNQFPVYLTVSLTLGRLNYSIRVNESFCDELGLEKALVDLAHEIGIKCGVRHVNEEVRFEMCNDPSLVWAPTAINILRSQQLEQAFKEFVGLQASRIIFSIGSILASKGIVKDKTPGVYLLLLVRNMGRSDILEDLVREDFDIVSKDTRVPLHVVYSLRSKLDIPTPLILTQSLENRLKEAGYNCTAMPAWGFSEQHEMIQPIVIEKEVEKIIEIEVEKIVEVEKRVEVEVEIEKAEPPLDFAALLSEPLIDS